LEQVETTLHVLGVNDELIIWAQQITAKLIQVRQKVAIAPEPPHERVYGDKNADEPQEVHLNTVHHLVLVNPHGPIQDQGTMLVTENISFRNFRK